MPTEQHAPGLNSADEVFTGIIHELQCTHGVSATAAGNTIYVIVGSVVIACGPFDGTWGVLCADSEGQQVAVSDSEFMAFADQEFRFCSHIRIAGAFMASIRSLRFSRSDDYARFTLFNTLSGAKGYWTHGRHRCYVRPDVNFEDIDRLLSLVDGQIIKMSVWIRSLQQSDLRWLMKAKASVRLWRKLADARSLLDFLTGVNDLAEDSKETGEELMEVRAALGRVIEVRHHR